MGYGYYGYGLGYGYISYLMFMLPAILVSMYASYKVNSTFRKYSKVGSFRRISGFECARMILDAQGLIDVRIERVSGSLTDHYDPKNKVVRLSESVYNSESISAISVAAHECGHAIQHQHNYLPLIFRNTIVPVVNFASSLSWIIILIGFFFNATGLVTLGIVFFSFAVLFQIVTLPVEFNASRRALKIITNMEIVDDEEVRGSRKVLRAAALTYVAAALTSIMQLLRLVLMTSDRN